MTEKLQIWIGPLLEQECEQIAAWCRGKKDNSNSLGHGKYIRTSSSVETTFENQRILQIDRFDTTTGKSLIEGRLSDSATLIRTIFDKAPTSKHRKEAGRSFKEGTEGGFIQINRYTLHLVRSSREIRRVHLQVQDFTYLGEEGASTVGNPKRVEEQLQLNKCLVELHHALSETHESRSSSPVHSQIGDSHDETQDLGISTQYLPTVEVVSEPPIPTNKTPTTTASLLSLLSRKNSSIRKPLGTLNETPLVESSSGSARASSQHVLQNLLSVEKSTHERVETSDASIAVSIIPDPPSGGSEKENNQEIRSLMNTTKPNGHNEPGNKNEVGSRTQPEVNPVHQDCPWDGLKRIPQRDLNVPKDQLKIIRNESSWIKSAEDLQPSSARLPPAVLREIDQLIDNQATHKSKPSTEITENFITSAATPARQQSTLGESDSENDEEPDWSPSPEREVQRAIDLPRKAELETKSCDGNGVLEGAEDKDEDETFGKYAEEISKFQARPAELYSPPNGDSTPEEFPKQTEKPTNNNAPVPQKVPSVQDADDDEETDEDDMELEVPHAIDDDDIDMPEVSSTPCSSVTETPKPALQVERTPRSPADAEVSSQDTNCGPQKRKVEGISSSFDVIIPGTLEAEISGSKEEVSITTSSVGLENPVNLKNDDNIMLDQQIQAGPGSVYIASTIEESETQSSRSIRDLHIHGNAEKTIDSLAEGTSRATVEAASNYNTKNKISSSSRLPTKNRRLMARAVDFNFSQSSQDEVDMNDLVRSNKQRFLQELGENVTASADLNKPASSQSPNSSHAADSITEENESQQPDVAKCAINGAILASVSGRHVSFDQLDGFLGSGSPEKISRTSPIDLTQNVSADGDLSDDSEKSANEEDPLHEETIFEKFIAVYPDYEGSLRAFVRCAAYLWWLQETKRGPHRSLYDDMIRLFSSLEYSEHIKDARDNGEQPMSLLNFYNDSVDTPIYREHIVSPPDLLKVLGLDPEEAAKSAQAFTERNSKSMAASRPTSVGSGKIPDHGSLGGIQATTEVHKSPPIITRKPFFETHSQLQSNTRSESTTFTEHEEGEIQVDKPAYEDTGPLHMVDDDIDLDDMIVNSSVTRTSRKRARLPWQPSHLEDAVSSPLAGHGTERAPSMSRFRQSTPREFLDHRTRSTPRSSVQRSEPSKTSPSLSILRSKFLGNSSLTPSSANKSKPHPPRRYTMLLPNRSLDDEFGDRRAAKRPRHSMPARFLYKRIEPATPAEKEFAKLAREFVPKRMSLDSSSVAGTPITSASSRESIASQNRRWMEPETQAWEL